MLPPYEGWEHCECPICHKIFEVGWDHPADQKLFHHLKKGRAHRSQRANMLWPMNGGNMKWWERNWWP